MRFSRFAAVACLTLGTAGFMTAMNSCTATPAKETVAAAHTAQDKIARGKYLTTIMSCNDCHTPGTLYGAPDMTRMLSGSELGWPGPWGVASARNLTPDAETGIGNWTEEQIVTALRTGNRPDGRQLAAIMPWQNMAALTDEDAYAIAAFLKSIPAVSHKVPDPTGPGAKPAVAFVTFPPPSGWDAMNLPKPPAP